MSTIESTDLKAYCLDVAQAAQRAAGELALVSGAQKDEWLKLSARLLREAAATSWRVTPEIWRRRPVSD